MPKPGEPIPFNHPPVTGVELRYIMRVLEKREFSGNGEFTARCHRWLQNQIAAPATFLTNSCSTALEMAAILARLEPGDEVIMPSFTFVSTANAIVLRGAVPVFVDIRPDTQNIDETLIESAITAHTKAICVVHYAGVCAEMDQIEEIARRRGLMVIEDAAQGLLSTYRGRMAGSMSDLGCLSFHETKNLTSGEGGAVIVNDPALIDRARIVWEKGTNRHDFRLGQVDKYTWVDVGSSFLPSEFTAAILLAQLEHAESVSADRIRIWERYHAAFAGLETAGVVRRPVVPPHCLHNGHIYYLILRDQAGRDRLIAALSSELISALFHYVPLHSAPAGRRFGRTAGELTVTDGTSAGLVRLPMHFGLTATAQDRVIDRILDHLDS